MNGYTETRQEAEKRSQELRQAVLSEAIKACVAREAGKYRGAEVIVYNDL